MVRIFKTPLLVRRIFPRRVWGFSSSDTVYLTFDDGPTPELTQWILDLLESKEVEATFFCVGSNAKKHPELMNAMIQNGHAIGNHTMRHEKGTETEKEAYHASIDEAAEYISSNLFRPPYGRLTKGHAQDLHDRYKIIMWSWLSYDFDPEITDEEILERANKEIKAGDILVLHDNAKVERRIKTILPEIIDLLKKKNLKFAKISV